MLKTADDLPEEDRQRIEYVRLDDLQLWANNPREGSHDLDALIRSILKHGLYRPILYDENLNDGAGGVAAGNGTLKAILHIRDMVARGDAEVPRGVVVHDGEWYIPVAFGLDSLSEAGAEGRALDDNLTMLLGGGTLFTIYQAHDPELLLELATRRRGDIVGLDDNDLLSLAELVEADKAGIENLWEDDDADEPGEKNPIQAALALLRRLNGDWPHELALRYDGHLLVIELSTGEVLGEFSNIMVSE